MTEPIDYYDGGDSYRPPKDWERNPSFANNPEETLSQWYGDKRGRRPWYDSEADYNTNSKSYYDYLAYRVRQLDYIIKACNDLLRRDLSVGETPTATINKNGDWLVGEGHVHTDIVKITADVKVANDLLQAIQIKDSGLYVKDLQPQIDSLTQQVKSLKGTVEGLSVTVAGLSALVGTLQKEVNDLNSKIDSINNQLQDQINSIHQEINNIWSAMNNSNYTTIPAEDFQYVFYNGGQDVPTGWGKVKAKILQSNAFSTVVIYLPWANPNFSSMSFNGGRLPLSNYPASYVAGFKFLGDYASLNDMQVTNVQFSNEAGHVDPTSSRASWAIGYNLDTSKTIHDEPFQITMASFADGYNDPNTLSEHYTGGLSMHGCPLTITLTLKGNDNSNPSTPNTPQIPEGDGILCTPTNPNGVQDLTRTVTREVRFYDEQHDPNSAGGNLPVKPNDNNTVTDTNTVTRKIDFKIESSEDNG